MASKESLGCIKKLRLHMEKAWKFEQLNTPEQKRKKNAPPEAEGVNGTQHAGFTVRAIPCGITLL